VSYPRPYTTVAQAREIIAKHERSQARLKATHDELAYASDLGPRASQLFRTFKGSFISKARAFDLLAVPEYYRHNNSTLDMGIGWGGDAFNAMREAARSLGWRVGQKGGFARPGFTGPYVDLA
jgi:hypothetical protein